MKFFFDSIITSDEIKCYYDEFCSKCDENGKCLQCHKNYKLDTTGRCICSTIVNCVDCSTDTKICNLCDNFMKLNTAVSP